jgi:hypothetical protein
MTTPNGQSITLVHLMVHDENPTPFPTVIRLYLCTDYHTSAARHQAAQPLHKRQENSVRV